MRDDYRLQVIANVRHAVWCARKVPQEVVSREPEFIGPNLPEYPGKYGDRRIYGGDQLQRFHRRFAYLKWRKGLS